MDGGAPAGSVSRFRLRWRTPKTSASHVPDMPAGEPVDYDTLEEFLRALAYSSRLELVSLLRQPRTLREIRLAPRQVRPGENPERTVSRQTLRAHLDKLMEVDLVIARDAQDSDKRGKEYAVNPQRFYQVLEEFRKVGTLTAGAPIGREATVDVGDAAGPAMEPGPKLMVVQGLLDGEVFPLRQRDLRDDRGWIIGRKSGIHVSLSYDPYVSLENTEILPDGEGGFELMDLRSSKNGTWLNWRRLDKGSRLRLTPGDVIGVGRSSLVFRGE